MTIANLSTSVITNGHPRFTSIASTPLQSHVLFKKAAGRQRLELRLTVQKAANTLYRKLSYLPVLSLPYRLAFIKLYLF